MASSEYLVLTADLTARPSVLDAAASLLSCSRAQLSVATRSGALSDGLPPSVFDAAVSFGPAGHHSPALLGTICKALKPGAKLVVQESAGASVDTLKRDLLLAGLTGAEQRTPDASDGSAAALAVAACKPSWETGAKATIALKPRAKTAAAAAPAAVAAAAPAAATAWKLGAGGDDDGDELIDEDELLTEEDRQRPAPAAAAADDCSTQRKACKDCSCGRAEAEAAGVAQVLTQEMLENPQSACGSCGLGDAFRCAGCPYKGLPAFKPGEKIMLGNDLLAMDV